MENQQPQQPGQGYSQQPPPPPPPPPNGYGPQPQYSYNPQNQEPGVFDAGPSGKSRGLAGLFAILLGCFGVHYFYIGKAVGGIICILLTFVTCGIWSFLTLIQGILMMTMRQEEFERKYVNTTSSFPLF